jgi:hypothetical protein
MMPKEEKIHILWACLLAHVEGGRVLEPARDASALLLLLSAIDVIVDVV